MKENLKNKKIAQMKYKKILKISSNEQIKDRINKSIKQFEIVEMVLVQI